MSSNKEKIETIDDDEDEEMKEVEEISTKKDYGLMWVEKYRPNSLDDLISHKEIISTVRKLVDGNKLPHLLFFGPPGTGKTSTAVAIAKQMFGNSYKNSVLELNASDDRGIDVIRDQIRTFASTRDLFSKGFKMVILDEADHMTKAAQNALRRVIEQYTKTTRFCLVCNYVNKIIPALQSRCTKFRFPPLKKQEISKRLSDIAQKEKVTLTKDGTDAIVKLSNGDMRKCLQILQSTSLAFDEVNETNVYLCTGNPLRSDVQKLVNSLINEPFEEAYQNINKLKTEKGLALQDIVRDVYAYVLRLHMGQETEMYLVDKLAELEYRLSFGTSEKLQLTSLIGMFQIAKECITTKQTPDAITKVVRFE